MSYCCNYTGPKSNQLQTQPNSNHFGTSQGNIFKSLFLVYRGRGHLITKRVPLKRFVMFEGDEVLVSICQEIIFSNQKYVVRICDQLGFSIFMSYMYMILITCKLMVPKFLSPQTFIFCLLVAVQSQTHFMIQSCGFQVSGTLILGPKNYKVGGISVHTCLKLFLCLGYVISNLTSLNEKTG